MSRLSQLSDRDLVAHLRGLVAAERVRLVDILEHVNEVRRRKLHLKEGYRSLFDYCVEKLGYSDSAAGRRLAAARALRYAPEAGPMLARGEVTLSTLSLVSRLLTPANRDALLERIRGRSHSEVKAMMAAYYPERSTRDRVRSVCVRERVEPGVGPMLGKPGAAGANDSPEAHSPGASAPASTPDVGSSDDGRNGAGGKNAHDAETVGTPGNIALDAMLEPPPTRLVHKHEIRFIAGKEFMDLLERMRALFSTPAASCEELFAAAMEAYINVHCPIERNRRRKMKRARSMKGSPDATAESPDTRKESGSGSDNTAPLPTSAVERREAAAGAAPEKPAASPVTRSRHVPAAVRDQVYERDGAQCTFVGPDGRRCRARTNLELDHIVPFALGGTHDVSNLRLRCRAHNIMAAEQTFGRDKVASRTRRE